MNKKTHIFILIILLTFTSIVFSQTYKYNIYFKGIKGGKASLSINKIDDKVHAKFLLKTIGIVDKFYSIRDTISVTASYPDYHTISLERIINEGNYHKHITFNIDEIDTALLSNPIRDEYTTMIMLMDSLYADIDSVQLNLYKKSKEITYSFVKKKYEDIKINGKNVFCKFYAPSKNSSTKLKKIGGNNLSIWATNTVPMKPIIIKFSLKYGKIILKHE